MSAPLLVNWTALAPELVALAVLLACSALFSASETALNALQAVDREYLRTRGSVGVLVAKLEGDMRQTLAAILMGNELVNVSVSAVGAGLILAVAPDKPWLNLVIITPLLLLFGEVTPKNLALSQPRKVALFVARPLYLWYVLATPVRWLAMQLLDALLRLIGANAGRSRVLEEEHVLKLLEQGRESGSIHHMEHELIDRLFDFSDTPVSRLMTPRPDVISFSLFAPFTEIVTTLRDTQFSRVPIWKGQPDNVVGILMTKDLLRFKGKNPPNAKDLRALLQEPFFVPRTKRAEDLLRDFRAKRVHMALVVDEHGSLTGLVTLDDLLGELVGEMLDEEDSYDDEISKFGTGGWTVAGAMDVEDFEEETGIKLPEGDYHTIGGFVLTQLGRIPDGGETTVWEGLRFTVTEVENLRITAIRVEQAEAAPVEPGEPA